MEKAFDRRIYTRSEQSNSRLDISKFPGQQQMKTLPNCFQKNLKLFREVIIGPVSFQTLPPTATIYRLAARPSKCSNRFIQQDFKYQSLYAIPPFSMKGRLLRKVQNDQTNMIIVTPAYQSQTWYPILLKMNIKNPVLLPNHPKILLSPEGKIISPIQNS